MNETLDTLGQYLVWDARDLFRNRSTKGMGDVSQRLQGEVSKDVFVQYRLRDKVKQTRRVSEFVFERVEKVTETSSDYMNAKSGSYIRLRLNVKYQQLVRPYSAISGDSNLFSLGIALADDSRGGSTFLHGMKVGDVVEASGKFANTFGLQEDQASIHIFVARGISITAFLDHMRECRKSRQDFELHYMIRNESDHAFKDSIDGLVAGKDGDSPTALSRKEVPRSTAPSNGSSTAKVQLYVSSSGKRCDTGELLSRFAEDESAHIYVCGSERLSEDIAKRATVLGIPNERLHYEQFTVDTSGNPFAAELTPSKRRIEVGGRQTLLDALREAGLAIPSSCEAEIAQLARLK